MKVLWFVYIAECSDSKLYVGVAKDVTERLKVHNAGHGGRFTKFRTPLILLYSEQHQDYRSARTREAELKGFSRAKKVKIIEKQ